MQSLLNNQSVLQSAGFASRDKMVNDLLGRKQDINASEMNKQTNNLWKQSARTSSLRTMAQANIAERSLTNRGDKQAYSLLSKAAGGSTNLGTR